MFPELDLRTRIALHMLQGVMADSFMKASGIAGVADDIKRGS